jgi:hypothetical protein
MDGSAIGNTSEHDRLGRFTAGNSAYAARRQRIEAKAEELALEYDVTTPSAKALVRLAAQHLDTAAMARNNVMVARHTRLAMKVLASLKRVEPVLPASLDEYLDSLEAK